MAKRINRVLLGFEDEAITDKYKSQVDFTCNKIGGKPDWPNGENRQNPTCCLCSLSLPLVLQIYAPIENSFHRTLYIFACINPNCWNQNGSWVCLRSHVPCGTGGGGRGVSGGVEVAVNMSTDWCEGADNWEDEQNGNTIELLSNQVSSDDDHDKSTIELLSNQVSSDEDHDITAGLAELNVNQRNTNANRRGGGMSGAGGGAMGRLLSPTASAEIEGGDESEVVTIDTPPTAQVNVISLFEQAAPVPQVPSSSLYFSPYFISVGEEERCTSNSPTNAEHVRELMHGSSHAVDGGSGNGGGGIGGSGEVSCEKYERSLPAHGDKMFHTFLCRIQSNPGQLLRYCRDGGSPLFLYPPHDLPSRCRYCHGELAFELQLLPTIIPRLRLVTSSTGSVDPAEHLEFGSVFLFACRRSCWTLGDSFREEQLYVQVEKI